MLEQDDRIDPSMGRNKAIRVASGAGDAEFVAYLLSLPKGNLMKNENHIMAGLMYYANS